jgi:hypothetical protein
MAGDSTLEALMAGNGPLPTGNARRRNAPTIPTDTFSAVGYSGEVPDPVTPLLTDERKMYDWAWTTPAACGWHWSDAEIVADWARLKALAARYMAGEVMKFGKDGYGIPAELPSALLTQITAREDRLYLSPMARKRGRTAIVDATPSAPKGNGNVVTPERWQRSAG